MAIHFNDGVGRGFEELTESPLDLNLGACFLRHLNQFLLDAGEFAFGGTAPAKLGDDRKGTLGVAGRVAPGSDKGLNIDGASIFPGEA